jgi:hypothetical protein
MASRGAVIERWLDFSCHGYCHFHVRRWLRRARHPLLSPYNDRWRELRKVCVLELFNQRRVLSFRPVREDEVARLLRSVSAECRDGSAVNLSEKICRMMNDVVVRAAIGGRCDQRDEFLHELEEAVRLTDDFNLADLYPSSRLVPRFSAAARDMGMCQRNIFRIVQSIIQERVGAPTADRDEDLLGVRPPEASKGRRDPV